MIFNSALNWIVDCFFNKRNQGFNAIKVTRSYWMKNHKELFHIHHSKYKLENIVANISKKTKIFQWKIKCVLWHPKWFLIHQQNKLQNKHKWSIKQFAIYLNEKNTTLIVHKKWMYKRRYLFFSKSTTNTQSFNTWSSVCLFHLLNNFLISFE